MESNLPTKLQQFSADPPEEVWSRIANALEESFPERLFRYEELPPADAWQAIAKELAERDEPRVVPFFKRFRTALRYAAVACFIAVVLVTITLTVKRTEAGALEAGSKTTVPEKASSTEQDKVPQGLTQQVTEESKTASQQQSHSTSAPETAHATTSTRNSDSSNPENIQANFSSLNNYVFFNDDDGIRRKVSKKLAGMVNCKDSDIACQERLQALRQKLAATAMTTDFMGILEMLRQLQQKP